jgi:Flp pilus assembly pilin Flp
VEYGLMFSLVAILTVMFFSGQGQTVLGNIGKAL